MPEAFMFAIDRAPSSIWVSDNRVALQIGREGPLQLTYTGRAGNEPLLVGNQANHFFECFRPSLRVGDLSYAAEEGRQVVAPFGLWREQRFSREGFAIRTGIWLAEDCWIFSYETRGVRRVAAWGELTIWPQCFELVRGRTWDAWRGRDGTISRMGRETRRDVAVRTVLAIAGSGGVQQREYRETKDLIHSSGKCRFSTPLKPGRAGFLVVAAGHDPKETRTRAARVAATAASCLRRQMHRYRRVAQRRPELRGGPPLVARFMQLAPLYLESLKKTEIPGVAGCKTVGGWMWLWDAAVPDLVRPLFGDATHAADAARLFAAWCDPRQGIPPWFPPDMRLPERSAGGDCRFEVQSLWELLVHDVAALTGNPDIVRSLYDRLRTHFRTMAATTAGNSGLLRGVCLFPDARPLMDETAETVSAYNNACWYNGCRKMERMALAMQDRETASEARALSLAIEASFWRTFWHGGENYLSASATPDLTPQSVFTSTATFWDFGFGDELSDGYQRRMVHYQLRNFYSPMGISMHSPHDASHWDRDGNQFHCSWPVMDSHNLKLALWARNARALAHFVPWVESMTARHSMSEAIQMRVRKDFPVIYDEGSWYGYSTSSWYRVVIECLLGVSMDEGGVTLTGTPALPLRLDGLHFRGARLDVVTRSRGWHIDSLTLDGKELSGTCKIAARLLRRGRHRIVVNRAAVPPAEWQVASADGSAVEVLRAGPRELSFRLTGAGLSRALLYAPRLQRVRVNGQAVSARRSERSGCWWVETVLERDGASCRIEAEGSDRDHEGRP
jgi:hypothetical protein